MVWSNDAVRAGGAAPARAGRGRSPAPRARAGTAASRRSWSGCRGRTPSGRRSPRPALEERSAPRRPRRCPARSRRRPRSPTRAAMMSRPRCRSIVCLGEAIVDLVCEREVARPREADPFAAHFGGALANVAVAAARAGAEVALPGGVGDDPWGDWLRERLADEGVELALVSSVADLQTPFAFVTFDSRPRALLPGLRRGDRGGRSRSLGEPARRRSRRRRARLRLEHAGRRARARAHAAGPRCRPRRAASPILFDPNLRPHRWRDLDRAAGSAARSCDGRVPACAAQRGGGDRWLTGDGDPAEAAAALCGLGARARRWSRSATRARCARGAARREVERPGGRGGLRRSAPATPSWARSPPAAASAAAGTRPRARGGGDCDGAAPTAGGGACLRRRGAPRSLTRRRASRPGRAGSGRGARGCCAIRDRLRELYGAPRNEPHRRPGRTSWCGRSSPRTPTTATATSPIDALRERFPSWEAGPRRPDRGGDRGDPPRRARRTRRRRGSRRSCASSATTSPTSTGSTTPRARRRSAYLDRRCPGVGRKTAACVMIFAFGPPRDPGRHPRLPGRRAARPLPPRRLLRGGPRRDARDHRPRGRLRAPHEPDRHGRASAARRRAARSASCADVSVLARAESRRPSRPDNQNAPLRSFPQRDRGLARL